MVDMCSSPKDEIMEYYMPIGCGYGNGLIKTIIGEEEERFLNNFPDEYVGIFLSGIFVIGE